jgi:hypothetical protein
VLARIGRSDGGTDWSVGVLGGQRHPGGQRPAAQRDAGRRRATPDLYAASRSAVFTHPDRTKNRAGPGDVQLQPALGAGSRLQALAYARNSRRDTVNGDGAEDFDPLQPDENASLNTTATRQSAWGAALSLAGAAARTSGRWAPVWTQPRALPPAGAGRQLRRHPRRAGG